MITEDGKKLTIEHMAMSHGKHEVKIKGHAEYYVMSQEDVIAVLNNPELRVKSEKKRSRFHIVIA